MAKFITASVARPDPPPIPYVAVQCVSEGGSVWVSELGREGRINEWIAEEINKGKGSRWNVISYFLLFFYFLFFFSLIFSPLIFSPIFYTFFSPIFFFFLILLSFSIFFKFFLPTRSVNSCNLAEIGLHAEACLEGMAFSPCDPTTAAPMLEEANVIYCKVLCCF